VITKIRNAKNLVIAGRFGEFFFELCKIVPFGAVVYVNFYFIQWAHKPTKIRARPLPGDCRLITRPYSEALLEKIRADIPHNLETVLYRAQDKEAETRVICIEKDETIIAVMFVMYDRCVISPSGRKLEFEDERVITCFNVYIKPEFRLKGLFQHLYREVLDLAISHGDCQVFGEIHFLNKSSILSHYRLGFRVFENVHYIQLFRRKFFFEGKKRFWCVENYEP
jgi:GNAT superfamily N-acetyltransferase